MASPPHVGGQAWLARAVVANRPEAAGRHHSFVAVSGQAFIASAAEREVDRHGERRRPSAGLFVGVSAVSINLRAPT